MNTIKAESEIRARLRRVGATLFGAALGFAITASALAADAVTLRVGDQKGGNRSLLEIAGLTKDLPSRIEWSEFPAAAPILEALNAGALDQRFAEEPHARTPPCAFGAVMELLSRVCPETKANASAEHPHEVLMYRSRQLTVVHRADSTTAARP